MLSLQVVDAEYFGSEDDWPCIAKGLLNKGLIGSFDYHYMVLLWCFGRMIHNTDMHTGNLSLAIEGDCFKLLPIYDMCSMGFAPKSGEVLPYHFVAPRLEDFALQQAGLSILHDVTQFFWNQIALDTRVSDELRLLSVGQIKSVEHT